MSASFSLHAQNIDTLRKEIIEIIASKDATIGVSIIGIDSKDTLSINGNAHFSMISVFKFHIALAILNKVDNGELSLNQKLFIKKKINLTFKSIIM